MTRSPIILLMVAVTVSAVLAGCAANPVPPAPAGVGMAAQNADWARQVQRSPDDSQIRFEPLTQARAAVREAEKQPRVADYDAQSLQQARQALASAQARWKKLAAAKKRPPAQLASVAYAAHRAQRLAEIAQYTARRELGLQRLVKLQKQRQQQQRRAAAEASQSLLGHRVIPDRFGKVAFESGTARLTRDSRKVVKKLAALLKDTPKRGVAIFGHTDNADPSAARLQAFIDASQGIEEKAPTKAAKIKAYNQALSTARARAVGALLVHEGIKARRIGARGFGSTRPVASNDTAAGRAANRRVVAVIVPGPDSRRRQAQAR